MNEREYRIDPEFNTVMEDLSAEDYRELEDSLLIDGFKGAPIIVWNGIIIDGHNRYSICKKHNIPYEVKELEFQSREEVIPWMVRAQLGRRNLTSLQRIKLVEQYRSLYEKQARENQLGGLKQNQNTVSQNSSKRTELPKDTVTQNTIPKEKIDVRAKLAADADVSTDTYSKGKKILDSDNEEVKEKVLIGNMSINAGYKEIKELSSETMDVPDMATNKVVNNPSDAKSEKLNVNSLELQEIKTRYYKFLKIFQSDIQWLDSKQFILNDEDVTSKIHSDLCSCFENCSNIENLIKNVSIDEFDPETIIINK